MATYVVRQDSVEFTGTITGVYPPLGSGATGETVGDWIFTVKPDTAFVNLLTTRNGVTNIDGQINCSVSVDEQVAPWTLLLPLAANANGRSARIVGTWCDEDDFGKTVIRPVGIVAVAHPIEVYDVNGWPVAVQDVELLAFAHSRATIFESEPHAGENRSLSVLLRFPLRPTAAATPFFRAYKPTVVDKIASIAMTPIDNGPLVDLQVDIETGSPADGKGFYYAQVGLTFDEPDLDNYCPPGTCDIDDHHCAHEGDFRFMRVPANVPYARTGDLVLSPGDGRGLISGIVASLSPNQVYDHMGIFLDNGWTIRHCTGSEDHMQDDRLYTSEISIKLAGIIELDNEKVPLNGLRPDLVRFGWPGSITQTVEEVFRNGRNSLNSRWNYAAHHAGADTEDPDSPGAPFRIYHLPPADRLRRRSSTTLSSTGASRSRACRRPRSSSAVR